ncbi:hypothetical protein L6164_035621 [Bauhinia variegata]|uniref:Uncharacterized protein n=1 Tax=Bauhinia variegata TaxID=167791 RepID=A0ACB9KEM9_BAUVA|nr:hypothetical protein L6164_035621 [Bauhinia variegata]
MSGLVDQWTSEVSKMHEKNQSHHHESSKRVQAQEKEKSSTGLAVRFGQLMQIHKPNFLYSEASISMLVEWFSA